MRDRRIDFRRMSRIFDVQKKGAALFYQRRAVLIDDVGGNVALIRNL